MDRIQHITYGKKKILQLDLSGLRSNDAFSEVIESAKTALGAYSPQSLYTLVNVDGVLFDSKTKKIVSQWMEFNTPYVRHGAVYGVDGIKKIMITSILKLVGRKNVNLFATREEALAWLEGLE